MIEHRVVAVDPTAAGDSHQRLSQLDHSVMVISSRLQGVYDGFLS
jgi:hypothetical protein